jgi:hypothetical protein
VGVIVLDRLQKLHQEVRDKKDDGIEQIKGYAGNHQNTIHSLL